jgi:spermidine synthase
MPAYSFLSEPDPIQLNQIVDLYVSAGWWTSPADTIELVSRIVAGSHCFCVAEKKGRIIGMGRAISDGASDAYIQDVTVHPAHRGSGIATAIVTRLVERLHQDRIGWIGLIAERGTRNLYKAIGFKAMDNSSAMIMLPA